LWLEIVQKTTSLVLLLNWISSNLWFIYDRTCTEWTLQTVFAIALCCRKWFSLSCCQSED